RSNPDATRKLRALWCLASMGGLDGELLLEALGNPSEYVRGWAVRLLAEGKDAAPAALARLSALAREDPSPWVRVHLASALERLPLEKRWSIVEPLIARGEDAGDQNLPLMLWYALEPLAAARPERVASLLPSARIPVLRRFAARRLALIEPG